MKLLKSKYINLVCITLLIVFSLYSCAGEEMNIDYEYSHEKNVVENFGLGGAFMFSFDVTDLQTCVNVSEMIVLGEILEIKDIKYDFTGSTVTFYYNMQIKEIYHDRIGEYKTGDIITVIAYNGYVPAEEYKKNMQNTMRNIKYNFLNKEYNDNEYVAFSDSYTGKGEDSQICFDVGGSYVVMLNPAKRVENNGYFAITSGHFLRELHSGTIYRGLDVRKDTKTYDQFINDIKGASAKSVPMYLD